VISTGGEDSVGEICQAGKLNIHVRVHPFPSQVLPENLLNAARRGVEATTIWDRGGGGTAKGAVQLQVEGGLVVKHIARQPMTGGALFDWLGEKRVLFGVVHGGD